MHVVMIFIFFLGLSHSHERRMETNVHTFTVGDILRATSVASASN